MKCNLCFYSILNHAKSAKPNDVLPLGAIANNPTFAPIHRPSRAVNADGTYVKFVPSAL